jgi:hypothetical protein
MVSTATAPNITLPGMGRKKKQGTPQKDRVSINLPAQWHAVARTLAARKRQPVTFLVIALLMAEAEREGIENLPSPPWEGD